MGLLSDFFIASETEARAYPDDNNSLPPPDRCRFKYISPLEAAAVLAVLRGVDDQVPLISEFKLLTPEDADHWTLSVPADMVELLARLSPNEIPPTAVKLARMTQEELGWTAEDFRAVLTVLIALSQRAIASGKPMFLWNCL